MLYFLFYYCATTLLYKSIAGKEFRKFAIEKKSGTIPVKVLKVHDLVNLLMNVNQKELKLIVN